MEAVMKYRILMIGGGMLLLFALTVVVNAGRAKPVATTPINSERMRHSRTRATPSVESPSPVTRYAPNVQLSLPASNAMSSSASYEIDWQSINGGGGPMSSANYSVNSSAGQASIGYATSANYQAGIGYWYGMAGGGCSCPYQSDYDEDEFLTAVDLGRLIDVLFAGDPTIQDPGCPTVRGDFNNDGFPDAVDLSGLIDHLFAGADPPCDPCDPVQSTCAK
jgi:hypothetical protein